MTVTELDHLLREGLRYGRMEEKRVYASPDAAADVRELDGCWIESTATEDPDFWLLGAYGFRVPLYVRENVAPGDLYVTE